MERFQTFLADERGAVTVDWVVLTGALVALTIAMFSILTEAIYVEAGIEMAERISQAGDVTLGN
jgi:Flp pilus assembly pilin Flp